MNLFFIFIYNEQKSMKQLNNYIVEKLKINKDTANVYPCAEKIKELFACFIDRFYEYSSINGIIDRWVKNNNVQRFDCYVPGIWEDNFDKNKKYVKLSSTGYWYDKIIFPDRKHINNLEDKYFEKYGDYKRKDDIQLGDNVFLTVSHGHERLLNIYVKFKNSDVIFETLFIKDGV